MSSTPPVPSVHCIMLVDDNEADNVYHEIMLRRAGFGGELVVRESAQQALDYLTQAAALLPNLILLDINMPGMNGFEFAREAAPLLQRMPTATVVMLTSSSLPNDRERAHEMPEIAGYVTKPLTVASARALQIGRAHV